MSALRVVVGPKLVDQLIRGGCAWFARQREEQCQFAFSQAEPGRGRTRNPASDMNREADRPAGPDSAKSLDERRKNSAILRIGGNRTKRVKYRRIVEHLQAVGRSRDALDLAGRLEFAQA